MKQLYVKAYQCFPTILTGFRRHDISPQNFSPNLTLQPYKIAQLEGILKQQQLKDRMFGMSIVRHDFNSNQHILTLLPKKLLNQS